MRLVVTEEEASSKSGTTSDHLSPYRPAGNRGGDSEWWVDVRLAG